MDGGGGGGGGGKESFLSAHRCPEVDLLPHHPSATHIPPLSSLVPTGTKEVDGPDLTCTGEPEGGGYLDVCSDRQEDGEVEEDEESISDWSEEDLSLHFSPSVIHPSEDDESDPESGFECVDIAMDMEAKGQEREGLRMVPKRQIQLKKRLADENLNQEVQPVQVNMTAKASANEVRPRHELLLRQHSMPSEVYGNGVYKGLIAASSPEPGPNRTQFYRGLIAGASQGIQKNIDHTCAPRRLQKSISLDETKTKMASCIIKNILSKKMQVEQSTSIGAENHNTSKCYAADRKNSTSDVKTSTSDRKSSISDIKTSTSDRKSSISDIKTYTSDRKTSISDIKTPTLDRKTSISDIKTSTSNRKNSTSDLKTSTSDRKTSISDINTSTSDRKASISDIKTSTSDRKTSISDIKTSTSDRKASTSEVKTPISDSKTSNSNVKTSRNTSKSDIKTSISAVKTCQEDQVLQKNNIPVVGGSFKALGEAGGACKAPVHMVRDMRSLVKNTYSLSFRNSVPPPDTTSLHKPTTFKVIGQEVSPPPTYQQAVEVKGQNKSPASSRGYVAKVAASLSQSERPSDPPFSPRPPPPTAQEQSSSLGFSAQSTPRTWSLRCSRSSPGPTSCQVNGYKGLIRCSSPLERPSGPPETRANSVPIETKTSSDHLPTQQVLCGVPAFLPAPGGGDFVIDVLGSSMAVPVPGHTPCHMMVDPNSGRCFYIDTPPQPQRKMLLDPETGQYVQVFLPPLSSAPNASVLQVHCANPTPTFLPVTNPTPALLSVPNPAPTFLSVMPVPPALAVPSLYAPHCLPFILHTPAVNYTPSAP
ncbi:mucin-5AC-like [Sphaeramia orbicularis]|uniref:mucin-5AC-like n=1 Tax=Sphaeramia orbicularis TaxID=375764 RepID=UPI00117BE037|nr:mucin-5AC-like [Sphaeramia orbicularis]